MPAPRPVTKPAAATPAPTPILTPEQEAQLAANVDAAAGSFASTASADLAVGDTGTGKSSLIGTYALEIFRATGKKTRLYSFDSGGYGALITALVTKGIIEVWRVKSRDPDGTRGMALGTCHLAALGCWPITRDPKTGDSPLGVALVAPTITWLVGKDAAGNIKGRWLQEASIPPELRSSIKTERVREITPGFEEVGGVAFDGLTSMSAYSMEELNTRAGNNELGGVQGNMKPINSGGIQFGVAGMGGIGFVQNRVRSWASAMATIPNLVRQPLVTALKARGDEKGMPIYGPQVEGKAVTHAIPSWFGNCLGLEAVPTRDHDGNPSVEYRIYLQPYALGDDPTVNKCKNRGNDPSLPTYISDPPGASLENKQLYSVWGMQTIYRLLDAAVGKNSSMIDELLGGRAVPGLTSGQLPATAVAAAQGSATGTVGKPAGVGGRPAPPPPPPASRKPGAKPAAVQVAQQLAAGAPSPAPAQPAQQVEAVAFPAPVPPAEEPASLPPADSQPAPVTTGTAPAQAAGGVPPALVPNSPPPPPAVAVARMAGSPPPGGHAATKAPVAIRKGPPPPPVKR